jgi:hypothetical protein
MAAISSADGFPRTTVSTGPLVASGCVSAGFSPATVLTGGPGMRPAGRDWRKVPVYARFFWREPTARH